MDTTAEYTKRTTSTPVEEEEDLKMGKEELRCRLLLASATPFGYGLGKITGELVGNVGNTLFNPLVSASRGFKFFEKLFCGLSDGITVATLQVKMELLLRKEKQIKFLKKRLEELEEEQEEEVVLTPEQERELAGQVATG
jgi:hypothetical protein